MYQFYNKSKAQPPAYAIKFLLTMKLTTLLIIAAMLQVSAASKAQTVTLSEKSAPLKEVFNKINDQTGFDFVVSTSVLKLASPVTITVKNKTLKTVLDEIFNDQPLRYQLQEKTVIVTRKDDIAKPKPKTALPPITIKGRVQDSLGKPLSGAALKNLATGISVTTDLRGQFDLQGNNGDKVQVSFVGYASHSFEIHQQQSALVITLYPLVAKLSEVAVVSTGYQTIPRERATGSFSKPIKGMYEDRVATDVLSKLNGITSGLVFNANTSGSQNGQLDINIRGRSTIFANDQPLIVIDNFPYTGDIDNINPNDVESISVLKDAAAASIWGVRAGNGVIVITTKSGRMNQPLKVGFNSSITLFNKPDLSYNPNQLNSSSYIELEKYLFNQGYYDASLTDQTNYPAISPVVQLLAAQRAGTISSSELTSQLNTLSKLDVNNQLSKYFYQKATNQQYGVNFSGGSDKANYYLSTGYDEDLASVKDNSNQRITINAQTNFYPAKDLEVNIGLNAVQANTRLDNTLVQTKPSLFPYSSIADANGSPMTIPFGHSQSFVQIAQTNGYLDWSYAPLKQLGQPDNRTRDNDIRFSTGIKYTLLKGLSAAIKYQYENSNIQYRDFESQNSYFTRNLINEYAIVSNSQVSGYNIPLGGILNFSTSNVISNNVRAQINYTLKLGKGDITALAGYELSQTSAESNSSTLYGYNDINASFSNIDPITPFPINPSGSLSSINSGLSINGTLERLRSSFANVAYTYDEKYIVSASARIDGSNYFGVATNQKSVPLWSIGGKWDINKESFYTSEWLPVLDFRATYGYNGNLDRSVTGVTTILYQSNAYFTNLPFATISNIGNPDLRWEKTGITNFGIDFGTKGSKIVGSLEYYLKKESDLLGFKSFPTNTGITSLEGNYANMSGHGFDLSVTSQNLTGNFKWTTTLFFSHATDKVTRYDVTANAVNVVGADGNQTFTVPVLGKPVFGVYSYKFGGLDGVNGNPIGYLNGVKSEDYANITQNTAIGDLAYSGPARPTYFGGLNNRFSYKGFDLEVQINYKLGYYFRKPTINYNQITSSGSSFLIVNSDFNNRWTKPGDENHTTVPSMVYPFSQPRDLFYQYSQENVLNGDNIRLQDVSFSYTFLKTNHPKLPVNSLQLFLYCNNVGILWRANPDQIDPDAVPSNNNIMPVPRSIAFGVKGNL